MIRGSVFSDNQINSKSFFVEKMVLQTLYIFLMLFTAEFFYYDKLEIETQEISQSWRNNVQSGIIFAKSYNSDFN